MYYSCFIGQEVGYYFISTKKKHFSISLGFHPLQRILVVTWEMEKKHQGFDETLCKVLSDAIKNMYYVKHYHIALKHEACWVRN